MEEVQKVQKFATKLAIRSVKYRETAAIGVENDTFAPPGSATDNKRDCIMILSGYSWD